MHVRRRTRPKGPKHQRADVGYLAHGCVKRIVHHRQREKLKPEQGAKDTYDKLKGGELERVFILRPPKQRARPQQQQRRRAVPDCEQHALVRQRGRAVQGEGDLQRAALEWWGWGWW